LIQKTKKFLGLNRPSVKAIGVAILAGLFVGYLPGELVRYLAEAYPNLRPESIEDLNVILASGNTELILVVALLIAILCPLVEELFFRGALWSLIGNLTKNTHIIVIITSLLFALMHMEPLHIIGVIPIGVAYGYLRAYSNSTIPCILAHMINNTLSIASAFT